MNNKSETMRWGTMVSYNNVPFLIGQPCGNKLHYFDLELVKSQHEISDMGIATVSYNYTLGMCY